MKSIKGTITEQNLLKSFAGESQARGRYTMFAKQAKKEGYVQIERLFLETADNERVHADRFFSFLEGGVVEITASYPAGKVGTTLENLKEAAAGENEEYTELYPEFAKIAKEEGFSEITGAYLMIAKAEIEHEKRFLKLAENIENDVVFKKDEKIRWKCSKCGYVHEGEEAPEVCPACLHPKGYYEIKETNY
ncbi:MAG: rubrerythrin family protein [Clostridiales bacterium]|nr:rubrerythrin family protein [Clostridiales bacterium]